MLVVLSSSAKRLWLESAGRSDWDPAVRGREEPMRLTVGPAATRTFARVSPTSQRSERFATTSQLRGANKQKAHRNDGPFVCRASRLMLVVWSVLSRVSFPLISAARQSASRPPLPLQAKAAAARDRRRRIVLAPPYYCAAPMPGRNRSLAHGRSRPTFPGWRVASLHEDPWRFAVV